MEITGGGIGIATSRGSRSSSWSSLSDRGDSSYPANKGHLGSYGGGPLSFSASGSGSSSRGGGSRRASFGGRNDGAVILRTIRDVVNRLRWDLVDLMGVPFEQVVVYIEDDDEDRSNRLCRSFLRQGTCDQKRSCKYSHAICLVDKGARRSSKSSGSIGCLRPLAGYPLEAAMSSTTMATRSQLHRAVFIEVAGEIVWDKEVVEVWDDFVRKLERRPLVGASAATSEVDDREEPKSSSAGGGEDSTKSPLLGNHFLQSLPRDVCLELWRFLNPADCGRSMATCKDWYDKAGDPGVWTEYLEQQFRLHTSSDQRIEYARLAKTCRNIDRLRESNLLQATPPCSPGLEEHQLTSPDVIRFHGHERPVLSILVDEARDRVISGSVTGVIRVWELHTGRRLGFVDLKAQMTCMAMSPTEILCGTYKGSLCVIDRDDLHAVMIQKITSSNLSSICLLEGRAFRTRKLLAGLGNGSFLLVEDMTPVFSFTLPVSHPSCVFVEHRMASSSPYDPSSPSSGIVACACPDQLFIWSSTGGLEDDSELDPEVPPRVLYACSGSEGMESRHSAVECCGVAMVELPDSAMVITACDHDVSLRWWDVDLGLCVDITPAFAVDSLAWDARVGTLSLVAMQTVLVSTHLNGSVVVWHIASKCPVAHYHTNENLEALVLTPSLGVLACAEKHVIYYSQGGRPSSPSSELEGDNNGGLEGRPRAGSRKERKAPPSSRPRRPSKSYHVKQPSHHFM